MKKLKFTLIILLLASLFSCKKETIETIPAGLYEVKLEHIKNNDSLFPNQTHIVEVVSISENYIVFTPVSDYLGEVQLHIGKNDHFSGELPISLSTDPLIPFKTIKVEGEFLFNKDLVNLEGTFSGYIREEDRPGPQINAYFPVTGNFYMQAIE
ncbi:hypothetical protein [Crocinitomix catalasitica]|uniref:hypothetical protein n=1 Tax=Crocinitomix catalasitica TaxID=184607 RepID=UPI000483E82B|nr:hypothetical protein [Crocinitomix catalasitica]